jgi:hypothetical protein
VKSTEKEALKRLIEYARLQAEQQHEGFTAYLLALATETLENRLGAVSDMEPTVSRIQ